MYIVKKNVVEEASTVWSYIVKRLELEPMINLLNQLLRMLMDSLSSYAAFSKFVEFFNLMVSRLELFKKFGIA